MKIRRWVIGYMRERERSGISINCVIIGADLASQQLVYMCTLHFDSATCRVQLFLETADKLIIAFISYTIVSNLISLQLAKSSLSSISSHELLFSFTTFSVSLEV